MKILTIATVAILLDLLGAMILGTIPLNVPLQFGLGFAWGILVAEFCIWNFELFQKKPCLDI